jgi:hypothetical protein
LAGTFTPEPVVAAILCHCPSKDILKKDTYPREAHLVRLLWSQKFLQREDIYLKEGHLSWEGHLMMKPISVLKHTQGKQTSMSQWPKSGKLTWLGTLGHNW